ncbi:hypothetical protein DIPPA_51155 [Diplonema papillatum]|nr:hypothetical protein DIPPA_51155 [Diplonema papillatum]
MPNAARSSIANAFWKGERFSFSSPSNEWTRIPEEVLVSVFEFCTRDVLLVCTEVCMTWFQVAYSCLQLSGASGCIKTSARFSYIRHAPIRRKCRGIDCLDPTATSLVAFCPDELRICPQYGLFAHRRFRLVYNRDSILLPSAIIHPFGKIIAGKTYFFLRKPLIHALSDVVPLLHLTQGGQSWDTSLFNPAFKLADASLVQRNEVFEAQCDIDDLALCKTHCVRGRFVECASALNCASAVRVRVKAGASVAEARAAARELLRLPASQAVALVSHESELLDDWQIMPDACKYIVAAVRELRLPALSRRDGSISVTILSPSVGVSTVSVPRLASLAAFKDTVLRSLTPGQRGMVLLQAQPGVILEYSDDALVAESCNKLLFDTSLIVAFVATSSVIIRYENDDTEVLLSLAANPAWSVKSLLLVFHAALRRCSNALEEAAWCQLLSPPCVSYFPSRYSLFSARVSISGGPYLDSHSSIKGYWDNAQPEQYFSIHANSM